ncbi:MAG: hypothetical protein JO297_17535 [Nitrososphaeraceae archaeon]|nr:hypothetical protein [Nitrososphaeraceae archaeon]
MKGKTPVQVGIELNLRQPEVTTLYGEYCKLVQLERLFQAYEDLNGDIEPFLELYRLTKAAGMNVQHVNKLLTIANHHLPSVQSRYDDLKRQVGSLEGQIRNSTMIFQDFTDQISYLHKTSDSTRLECEKEKQELESLQQKRMKQEGLIRQFENDNEAYNKIRKDAKENVTDALANRKELLRLAIFCVIESIRMDPDKYCPLIYYNDDANVFSVQPTISPIAAYYNRSSYTFKGAQEHQQNYLTKDSFKHGYIEMLIEEAEKLFTGLEKMLIDEVIYQYMSKTSTSSLSMLPLEDKHQTTPSPS